MFKDTNKFSDLESFIEHLKQIDNIVGIVEYGGRSYCDMRPGGGDYDLTVIFKNRISENFNGVHFHIAGIPVDCMILCADDFMEDPRNEFFLVHLNCTILYDRDNTTKNILDRIKRTWKTQETISDFERNIYRFTFRHIIDKLEHRLSDDVLFSKFFIFSSFNWFLDCYSRINKLEVGKPKSHLKYIRNSDPDLFVIIEKLYSSNELEEQFEMLKKCACSMLRSIGGEWADDEILFHLETNGENDPKEQEKAVKLLLGE